MAIPCLVGNASAHPRRCLQRQGASGSHTNPILPPSSPLPMPLPPAPPGPHFFSSPSFPGFMSGQAQQASTILSTSPLVAGNFTWVVLKSWFISLTLSSETVYEAFSIGGTQGSLGVAASSSDLSTKFFPSTLVPAATSCWAQAALLPTIISSHILHSLSILPFGLLRLPHGSLSLPRNPSFDARAVHYDSSLRSFQGLQQRHRGFLVLNFLPLGSEQSPF